LQDLEATATAQAVASTGACDREARQAGRIHQGAARGHANAALGALARLREADLVFHGGMIREGRERPNWLAARRIG
jgi:hypothetical protein